MKFTTFKEGCLIGVTLFSLFFGAGNLIFAPFMGAQAGMQSIAALAGFGLTAVVCPVAAVLLISQFEDAWHMLSRIAPWFALAFLVIVYLMIGPGIAIPRTATTSFEMLTWLVPDTLGARIVYSLLFFGVSMFCALHPSSLKDILGKFLTPVLILLVLMVCLGSLFFPSDWSAATAAYSSGAFGKGLNEGYQTMDILAAYCFGPVLMINIRSLKPREGRSDGKLMSIAAIVCGILLACLYSLLGFCAARQSGLFQVFDNGALILLEMAGETYGSWGRIFCSLIFLIACFNVCTGLLSCCAAFFSEHFEKISYRIWLYGFTAVSFALSLFGLTEILKVSAPVLSFMCPIALLLLVYGFVQKLRQRTSASKMKNDTPVPDGKS